MTPRTALLAATLALTPLARFAEGKTHHLAVHVDESDRQKLNLALNNVQNLRSCYAGQGDAVVIEVVATGRGCACSSTAAALSPTGSGPWRSKATM